MMVTWKAGLFAKHGLDITRPRLMGSAKGVVRGLMAGEIQFGNLAAPAPLRADLKGEADVVFLTGGINQQFVIGRPGLNSRMELAGKENRHGRRRRHRRRTGEVRHRKIVRSWN